MTAPDTDIWIIEDHDGYRRAISTRLNRQPGFHCGGAFAHCEGALEAMNRGSLPDVILLDVGFPGMSGITAIPLLRGKAPNTLVILLTVFDDEEKIKRAISAGASGYLLKTASLEEIVKGIRDALDGGAPMNSRITRRVLEMLARMVPEKSDYGLSPREAEILKLLVDGKVKKEIAALLDLSIHTVDTHLRHIYEKMQVNTRTGAVAKALKEGLV